MSKKEAILTLFFGMIISVGIIILLVHFLFFTPLGETKYFYKVTAREKVLSTELKEVLTAYGMDSVYVVEIGGTRELKVSEDTYNKYFRDFNSITVNSESLYVARQRMKGFISKRLETEIFLVERIDYPFLEARGSYSYEDAIHLCETLFKDNKDWGEWSYLWNKNGENIQLEYDSHGWSWDDDLSDFTAFTEKK